MVQDFTLAVAPVAKGRPRFTSVGGHGRAYTPAKTRTGESSIKAALIEAGAKCEPTHTPLYVEVVFGMKKPIHPLCPDSPATRPDLDQLVKSFLDAGNGVLWADDAQIVELRASKEWAEEASISVHCVSM